MHGIKLEMFSLEEHLFKLHSVSNTTWYCNTTSGIILRDFRACVEVHLDVQGFHHDQDTARKYISV